MFGWRARLGFLVPPGCPTVEGELPAMLPAGVTAHYSRMVAHGTTGSLSGQEERNRSQIEHIDETAALSENITPLVCDVADSGSVATALDALGRRLEALDEYALALRLREEHLGSEHPRKDWI